MFGLKRKRSVYDSPLKEKEILAQEIPAPSESVIKELPFLKYELYIMIIGAVISVLVYFVFFDWMISWIITLAIPIFFYSIKSVIMTPKGRKILYLQLFENGKVKINLGKAKTKFKFKNKEMPEVDITNIGMHREYYTNSPIVVVREKDNKNINLLTGSPNMSDAKEFESLNKMNFETGYLLHKVMFGEDAKRLKMEKLLLVAIIVMIAGVGAIIFITLNNSAGITDGYNQIVNSLNAIKNLLSNMG